MTMDLKELYLDIVKRCLMGDIHYDLGGQPWHGRRWQRALAGMVLPGNARVMVPVEANDEARAEGRLWLSTAHTMIGKYRMDNVRFCIESVLNNNVPGDVIETGVWRGGATIWMRAILKAHGVTDRTVWVADSFEGLPVPNATEYPADAGDRHHEHEELAISLEQVQANFSHYGLLDDQVRFLKGWFRDTLPKAPIEQLAVVRLDGDMYESTMDGLNNLYHKLSPGGFLIVDDYGAVPACAQAVEDFRKQHSITEPLQKIDWTGTFWQKRMN